MIRITANHNGVISVLDTTGTVIELNYEFGDIFDITTRRAPFSLHFTLPFSQVNSKFFGYYYDVNMSTGAFNPYVKTLVEVFGEGDLAFTGYLELTSLDITNKTFEATIISSVANVFDIIKALPWTEVLEGALDHPNTGTAITNSFDLSNDITLSGAGNGIVVYSLADCSLNGQPPYANHPFFGGSGSNGNSYGVYANPGIQPAAMRPMVQVKYLINKIFNSVGYVIESVWMSTMIDNLYMSVGTDRESLIGRPFNTAKVGILADTLLSNDLTLVPFSNEAAPSFSDLDGFWANNQFTAPITGNYNFTIKVNMSSTAPAGTSGGIESVIILVGSESGWVGGDLQYRQYSNLSHYAIENVSLQEGEVMEVHQAISSIGTYTYYPCTALTTGSYIRLNALSIESESSPLVTMAENFPEVTCNEFLKGIIEKFNLYIWQDTEFINKIRIEPYPDYVANYTSVIDWTRKIDYSQSIIIKPTTFIQNKQLNFEDAKSKDLMNANFDLTQDYVFGRFLYNNTNAFTEGTQRIGGYFSPMRLRGLVNPMYDFTPSTTDLIPTQYTEDFKIAKNRPFLAFYHGTTFTDNLSPWYIGGIATALIPVFTTWSESPVTSNSWSVMFGPSGAYDAYDHPNIALENVSLDFNTTFLYNKYWKPLFKDIYSDDARHMTCTALLNANDVRDLKWNDRIYIKDSYWRLQKIAGIQVGRQSLCTLELVKTSQGLTGCDQFVDTLGVSGQVSFVDAAGDPINSTIDCCEDHGFIWDATRSKCYWLDMGGGHGGGGNSGQPNTPTGVSGTNGPPQVVPFNASGWTEVTSNPSGNGFTQGVLTITAEVIDSNNVAFSDIDGVSTFSLNPFTIYNFEYVVQAIVVTGVDIGATKTTVGVQTYDVGMGRNIQRTQNYVSTTSSGTAYPSGFDVTYTSTGAQRNITFEAKGIANAGLVNVVLKLNVTSQNVYNQIVQVTPGAISAVLLETGDYLLLETGDKLLLNL